MNVKGNCISRSWNVSLNIRLQHITINSTGPVTSVSFMRIHCVHYSAI